MRRSNALQQLAFGFLVALVMGGPAFADASWKLYDLRDLLGLLPHAPDGDDQDGRDSVDALLSEVCTAMDITCTHYFPGVYGIEAEDADHSRVESMLEAIRGLYSQRYAVELTLTFVNAAQAPSIGAEAKVENPAYCQRLVVPQRTPTQVRVLSTNKYLSGLMPVVAQSAVGYGVQDSTVNDGLEVTLVVGANGNDPQGIAVEVSGELRQVTWPDTPAEVSPADSPPIRIRFPVVAIRSVQSYLNVKYEKPTVLSVLAGFKEGESIVIAVSVRRL